MWLNLRHFVHKCTLQGIKIKTLTHERRYCTKSNQIFGLVFRLRVDLSWLTKRLEQLPLCGLLDRSHLWDELVFVLLDDRVDHIRAVVAVLASARRDADVLDGVCVVECGFLGVDDDSHDLEVRWLGHEEVHAVQEALFLLGLQGSGGHANDQGLAVLHGDGI